MRTAVTRDYGNIKKSSNHKAQAKIKKKKIHLSVPSSVFQKHASVVSTGSLIKQESDSPFPGVSCMLSPHLDSQSFQV